MGKLSKSIRKESLRLRKLRPIAQQEIASQLIKAAKAESPVRTGRLRSSHLSQRRGDRLQVGVDSTVSYAGIRHAFNPWLRRAMDRSRTAAQRAVSTRLKREI